MANKSPSRLISECTVLEASQLLEFMTAQVAYKTGFDDASYFVKYAKGHMGSYRTGLSR